VERFDLLIIGGGINGTAIARDSAIRGASVLLVEKDDLAAHTSSSSSKLIHGGLRYLEYGEVRLVREALRERETLLRIAPHIVRPLRFVLPHMPGHAAALDDPGRPLALRPLVAEGQPAALETGVAEPARSSRRRSRTGGGCSLTGTPSSTIRG
jgi:glycerol-3-phosphate dehydrogenase